MCHKSWQKRCSLNFHLLFIQAKTFFLYNVAIYEIYPLQVSYLVFLKLQDQLPVFKHGSWLWVLNKLWFFFSLYNFNHYNLRDQTVWLISLICEFKPPKAPSSYTTSPANFSSILIFLPIGYYVCDLNILTISWSFNFNWAIYTLGFSACFYPFDVTAYRWWLVVCAYVSS